MPAYTGLWWRTVVTARVTYASAPKNVNVSSPRVRMTAGSPGRAVSVPGGTSRRRAGSPITAPARISAHPASTSPDPAARVSPASSSVAPAAVRSASISLGSPVLAEAGGPRRTRAGTAIDPATATTGSRPRNTHRQPKACATSAATTGPASPGRTQAVDSTAIIRARSEPGRHRPIAA